MNHAAPTLTGNVDMDPLSNYEYPSYDTYPNVTPLNQAYPYQLKLDQSMYNTYQSNNTNYVPNGHISPEEIKSDLPTLQTAVEPSSNVNEDSKPVSVTKRKKNKNGQKSTYCSEKITDATFPFYGCSVCNISYTALHELDQHVTVHKNRMTSYRLRLRNQYKKKQIKKEKKKLKKLIKVKKENDFDVEIKPEEGYIGNEKASDFVNNGTSSNLDCKGHLNLNNGTTGTQDGQMNLNNVTNSINSSSQENNSVSSNMNSTDNGSENISNELENGTNTKENSMDEAELNNLEKIYKCFACLKQFTLSYYLKLHVRSHTDEKPYTCSVCGQSFITASKLGRHNKRIHLAERYQCRICFKIFSRFELLTTHFDKTHPEDKLEGEPYDYNAILPYLKELEEQLLAPADHKDDKPKADDLLWGADVGAQHLAPPDVKQEFKDEDLKDLIPKVDVEMAEVKYDVEIKVKEEPPAEEALAGDVGIVGDVGDVGHAGGCADEPDIADDADDDVKDEDRSSDEDYFPSNTWAASPAPSSPPPARARRGAGGVAGGAAGGGAGGGAGLPEACTVCNKRVSSASYMRVHMRTHTGERPFKCYTCGRGFITRSKMHRHVLTHQQDKDEIKIEPEVDVKEPPEDDEPTDGAKKPAKKKSKMKSKLSKKKNADQAPRRKHQKRPHACEYCNQKFLHLNMLEVHKKSHEGEALVLRCNYCLIEARDAEELRTHEAEHRGPKPYLCTICGKTYKKRETMVYHKKRHSPDKEFVCEMCSKRFNAACKLHKHMVTHRAGRYVLRYECPVCAHMFNTKYHVHMHLNTHQKEGLILEENRNEILAMVLQNARKIPKQADAPANLTDIIPSDERSRICNICGEIFHHFYYLEEHLKSHGSRIAVADVEKEEEKKYICQICNKGFKLHYYLKLHSFTHSKEKPFICQQCGKGFITKGKLKRHLETHTGLKKYQCHICYKFFTRPSYLRIHIRTIHGTQDYNFRFDKSYGLGPLAMSAMAMSDVSQTSI